MYYSTPMTKTLALGLLAALVGMLGCKENKRKDGLPPATEWRADQDQADQSNKTPRVPSTGADPHAGLGIPSPDQMRGDPHADMGGGDPHAGMNMGGGDPHAGMNMGGGDPHAGGMGDQAIPARKPHPDRTLAGVITLSPKVKDQVPPGAVMFIYAKRFDPKTGGGVPPSIVTKIEPNPKFPYKFQVDESNSMSGLPLTGTVVLEVRLDGDRNASSRQKGDVIGRVKVKVPNKTLKLSLDTVLKEDVQVGGM